MGNHRRTILMALALAAVLPARITAENPQQAFARSWEGKTVVLKQMLYTLVYNERGKLGNTRSGRRDGLVVVTPPNSMYFQFDGRHGKDDVVTNSPQRIIDAVNAAYEKDTLEVQPFRKVEPLTINRFAVGFELIIGRVRVERDTVRISLGQTASEGGGDPDTSLTVKWPAPFSKSFPERHAVEELMRLFVDVKQPS